MQSSNSSESFESFQGLSSSASCSAPTTSVASRPTTKRKTADANDLGVDESKQVRLRAYPVNMFAAKKRRVNVAWYQRWDWLDYSVKFDAAFAFIPQF